MGVTLNSMYAGRASANPSSRSGARIILHIIPALATNLILACSTASQSAPAAAPLSTHASYYPEQCSTFGVMACKAMAAISRDSAPTCNVFRASDGTRVESCGSKPETPTVSPSPLAAQTYPVQIAWSDNSDNETSFIIERCDIGPALKAKVGEVTCNDVWKIIGTVAANTTHYRDDTSLVNRSYAYRVKAVNRKGSSEYTQEAVITTPAQ
jgi:hypothetical protein